MLAAVVEKPGQLVVKEVDKPKPGPQESLMATMIIIRRFWDMKCVGKW